MNPYAKLIRKGVNGMKFFITIIVISTAFLLPTNTFGNSKAQLSVASKNALEKINAKEILEVAKTLSSAEYQGRKAGSPGARLSGLYIAEQFRQAGLLPGGGAGSYFRAFKIRLGYKVSSSLEIHIKKKKIKEFTFKKDYMPVYVPKNKTKIQGYCVLVGYGISAPKFNFDEYKNLNVKGKIAIVFSGTPWDRNTRRWIGRIPEYKLVDTLAYKVQNAQKHGAVGVFIVDDPGGWRKELKIKERLRIPDTTLKLKSDIPVVHITKKVLSEITMLSKKELRALALDIARDQEPQPMVLVGKEIHFDSTVSGKAWIGRNIIGILPGSHPALKKEAIVIGAHYDHLGEMDEEKIYFGANDNASGVSSMLSIARAFTSLAKAPKRTIVFIAFDAEEIGKIGSKHYVLSPALPIKKTVMMINFDMVGRNEPNHIYAVGTRSSPELHVIHQKVNKYIGLNITNPESYRLGRSDHTYFYYASVPIMYLFGGKDPDYNTPQDTWEKLIPNKMEKVARLAFLTAWEVAEKEKRITYVRKED